MTIEEHEKKIERLERKIEDQANRISNLENANKVLNERILKQLQDIQRRGQLPTAR